MAYLNLHHSPCSLQVLWYYADSAPWRTRTIGPAGKLATPEISWHQPSVLDPLLADLPAGELASLPQVKLDLQEDCRVPTGG